MCVSVCLCVCMCSFAEILMHMPYGKPNGLPYFGNLRGAKATDTYIMSGKSPEVKSGITCSRSSGTAYNC